jgi:hypothetical protein
MWLTVIKNIEISAEFETSRSNAERVIDLKHYHNSDLSHQSLTVEPHIYNLSIPPLTFEQLFTLIILFSPWNLHGISMEFPWIFSSSRTINVKITLVVRPVVTPSQKQTEIILYRVKTYLSLPLW